MNFELPYTEQQEQFRSEVKNWIAENVPNDMRNTIDPEHFTEDMKQFWRGKHQELATKGWLYPTYPTEYGGGGLSGEHETILPEEFRVSRVPGNFTNTFVLPALLVWGTEEQKQKFLVPLLKSTVTAWQKFTEPSSGADLANYESKATRDGDDWRLTGQSVFVSGVGKEPEYLYGPMMTDPDAPRHRNLGFFMIPVRDASGNPTEGLEIRNQNLVNGADQHFIFMDDVRIASDHLIGGDHQGWQVTQTSLEQEHGGRGNAFPDDSMVDHLLTWMQNKHQTTDIQKQTAIDAYNDFRVDNILAKRTYWMYSNKMSIQHEGNVANVHNREYQCRNQIRVRDVMGPYAMLDSNDPRAPHQGEQEVRQRALVGMRHAGGSTNIAKVVLARRIGISRTQEKAAPTPSTATAGGS